MPAECCLRNSCPYEAVVEWKGKVIVVANKT